MSHELVRIFHIQSFKAHVLIFTSSFFLYIENWMEIIIQKVRLQREELLGLLSIHNHESQLQQHIHQTCRRSLQEKQP